MITDYLRLATKGIVQRGLRSWLTIIGIFIGITAVVILISLGQGLQGVIDQQFRAVGGDRILVSPGGGGTFASPPGFASAKLGQGDLNVVRGTRGVDNAIGMFETTARVKFRGQIKYVPVFAVPTDSEALDFLRDIDFFVVEEGRYLTGRDKYKAQVGVDTGNSFGREITLGDEIFIEGKEFSIIGINKKTGNPFHDMKITIPIDTAYEIFNKSDEFSMISVKVKKGFNPSDIAEDIKEKLRRHRDVPKDEEDFSVETAEGLVGAFKNVISVVQIVLVGIAAISLIVGGVGIMNTMYTSVLERTRHIGIMKSVGARNSDILLIFIIESGILGLVGGIVGIITGIGLSKAAEFYITRYVLSIFGVYISAELIIGALLFSFIVGCISGFLPARRAAMMKPVDALRYR
jgi:putative ABC transport system permease protein